MIATEHFVFIHLHKSGGSFINAALMEYFKSAKKIGYHLPVSELPQCYAHLPLLGVVRNPWSYYVSWYEFQKTLKEPTFVWRVFSDDGRLGFEGTIQRMLHCGQDRNTVHQLIRRAPENYSTTGVNVTRNHLRGLHEEKGGWYTFLFKHMYGNSAIEIIQTENLRRGFYEFLIRQMDVSDELKSFIFGARRLNATSHSHYSDYYTPTLIEDIAVQEKEIVERFGYMFGHEPEQIFKED
jgi:hypothetical protein